MMRLLQAPKPVYGLRPALTSSVITPPGLTVIDPMLRSVFTADARGVAVMPVAIATSNTATTRPSVLKTMPLMLVS